MDCGHCGAVCSAGAIESNHGTFAPWTAPTLGADVAKAFLAGRRSIRHYREESIPRETLDELMSIAPYASTASNAQDVSATLLTQGDVFTFASLVNDYYRSIDRLLSLRVAWPLLWFTPLRTYLESPEKLARARERIRNFSRRSDWLFFGAPAVVVLSAPSKHELFGRVNCTIVAERIMQYAAALGLGSCYIGYADVAMRRRRSIADEIGIASELGPCAVFTLGYPAVTYRRLPARRPMPLAWSRSSRH
jgi:nitroreductase